MIKSVLEEMSLIKYMYDLEHRDKYIEDAFDYLEVEVLNYMRTLGEITQKYTHKYGCTFWCECLDIQVDILLDDEGDLNYSVTTYEDN